MIEIDLLKYFDKSFSEIDEILHSKKGIYEQEEEKDELTSVIKQKKKKSYALTYLTFAALFIIAGLTGYKFYNIIKQNLVTLTPHEEKTNKQTIPPIKASEPTPEKETIPTYKLEGEDVVIGTIEFLGENLPPIAINNIKIKENTEVKLSRSPQTEIKSDIEKKESTKKEMPAISTYSVKLYYIDSNILENIKKKLQSHPDKKLSILGKNTKGITKWYLYKPTKGTKNFIGSREVAFIKSFNSKYDAINYAKKQNISAIIVKKSIGDISYDLTISGFNSIQDVLDFIKPFNIEKKSFHIQKK